MTNELITKLIFDESLPVEAKRRIIEMLRVASRGREDICVFAEEMLGMPLNDFQKNFLRRTTTPRTVLQKLGDYLGEVGGMLFGKNIAFPSNQVGKTVMIAIKHLWFDYYKIGLTLTGDMFDKAYYATLNISPHTRQVKQCSRYMMEILGEQFVIEEEGKARLNKISPLLKGFILGFNATIGEMRFANGAIMYSVPVGQDQAASLAGGQFAYISYDECAQSHHLEQELGAKILSRLIKYGVGLDLISTAEVDAPSHQYYHRIVQLGLKCQELWWAIGGNLDQNKFIPEQQREKIKADLKATDKKKYRQVVFGEFVTGGKRFFEQSEIDQLWKLPNKKAHVSGRKYVLVADWGMADTGDPSEFAVLDYTEWTQQEITKPKIYVVNWETILGGNPHVQFALLRALYEAYTDYGDDGVTVIPPIFVMDANALGGVTIRKLLKLLNPQRFAIEKDEALLMLKNEMSDGRKYYEDGEGNIIEEVPEFGSIQCYFIQELADQLGMYHLDDAKLKQDKVMTLMMGVSWIVKKHPHGKSLQDANISRMSSWKRSVKHITRNTRGFSSVRSIRAVE